MGEITAVQIATAALLTALVCLVYRRYPAFSAKAIARFQASTSHIKLYMFAAMVLPLVLRLAALPWVPPPEPHVHDEFGHLLVADTLAAGRLANPPHPLWRHLDTIYVLQQPAYASSYPIGQGIILATGKLLTGHPWAGVLVAVALMCGAITWMLFGCLPPNWAAVGGLLAALNYGLAPNLKLGYGLAPSWIDSYWGGAFCAFGGALLFGALFRLRWSPSRTMALMVGLGWSIVWLTRPFESIILLLATWGLIAAFIIRDRGQWRRWLGPITLILAMQVFTGGVTALHNRAVTGSFIIIPYRYSQQIYGVPQTLLGQKAIEEPALRFPELIEMYWWQREAKARANAQPIRWLGEIVRRTWEWFLSPWYSLPILLLIFLLNDRQVIFAAGTLVCALSASALYPFFFPHYIAAYSCVMFFLIIRGMMTLHHWSFRGKLIGPVVVLFLMFGGLMTGLRTVPLPAMLGFAHNAAHAGFRAQVADRLMRLGGRHVVFVRYGANNNFHDEWVYNAADVDASPIVWCRASDRIDETEVTEYYKDRHFWLATVDRDTVRVSRYQPGRDLSISTEVEGGESGDWLLGEKPRSMK